MCYDNIEGESFMLAERLWIFMKITICVGSTCHLLGSKHVVERFKELVEEYNVQDKIELAGKFCMGKCGEGVCISLDETAEDGEAEKTYLIQPEDSENFFKTEVLPKL